MIEFPLIAVTHARVHEIDVPRSLYLNSNSIKNEKITASVQRCINVYLLTLPLTLYNNTSSVL